MSPSTSNPSLEGAVPPISSSTALARKPITLVETVGKTIVVHSVTYMLMGLLASTLLNYREAFATSELSVMMRPFDDPMIIAGPLLQPIRGILFGIVFYMLREPFFKKRYGWLSMFITLVILGILSTFGPTPGSVEGMIYTIFPISLQLMGLPEVVLQALLLSGILFVWIRNPERKWLSWLLIAAFVVLLGMPALGLLML